MSDVFAAAVGDLAEDEGRETGIVALEIPRTNELAKEHQLVRRWVVRASGMKHPSKRVPR